MTPLIIHYINVCLMFYLMCCLSVLFTICSFNHTWEQLRCHTTFSNPAVTLHSATRLSHYIPQPGWHTTFSNPPVTLHSATRPSHYNQQPGCHTTFSNLAVTLHSATRPSHSTINLWHRCPAGCHGSATQLHHIVGYQPVC